MTACFSTAQRPHRCRLFFSCAPRSELLCEPLQLHYCLPATTKSNEKKRRETCTLLDVYHVAFLLHCATVTFELHGCRNSFFYALILFCNVFEVGWGWETRVLFFRHAFLFSVRRFPNCNDACMSEHLQPSDLGLTVNSWGKFRMLACVCVRVLVPCRRERCRLSCRLQVGFSYACTCVVLAGPSPMLADAAVTVWESLWGASFVAPASWRFAELERFHDSWGKVSRHVPPPPPIHHL